mgnify:CR=1 FL=1
MAASVVVAQESQLRSSFYPGHLILLIRSAGDLPVIAAVRVHDENFAITLVLRYTVVCYRIRNFFPSGDTASPPIRPIAQRASGVIRFPSILISDFR